MDAWNPKRDVLMCDYHFRRFLFTASGQSWNPNARTMTPEQIIGFFLSSAPKYEPLRRQLQSKLKRSRRLDLSQAALPSGERLATDCVR